MSKSENWGEPPPGGGGDKELLTPNNSSFGTTSAWAQGAGIAGSSRKQRSFLEIMADERKNRNILEIKIVYQGSSDINEAVAGQNRKNLSYDEIGAFLFDTLKIDPSNCLRFNYTTGRSDTKEVMFKPGIDISQYIGTFNIPKFEIITRKQQTNV